jgi:hypothetical protein
MNNNHITYLGYAPSLPHVHDNYDQYSKSYELEIWLCLSLLLTISQEMVALQQCSYSLLLVPFYKIGWFLYT